MFCNSDGSLKWLVVCMVSAEMINCKLLSTQAADIKHFTLHDVKSPLKMTKSKFRASNTLLNNSKICHNKERAF
jgi:hypothetical protein